MSLHGAGSRGSIAAAIAGDIARAFGAGILLLGSLAPAVSDAAGSAVRAPHAAGSVALATNPGEVDCHLHYGGEDSVLRVAASDDPYRVPTVPVGSYFLFRAVLEIFPAAHAALKVYVLADLDRGPVPLHQGDFSWPPAGKGRHGFTGLHRVYEPLRDGELVYWCELLP